MHVPVVYLAAGGQHSAALTKTGHLITWGSNKFGQLGYCDEEKKFRYFLYFFYNNFQLIIINF